MPERKKVSKKVWDRVFKTLLFETPKLFLPLINEVFGTSYQKDCEVSGLNGELYKKDGTLVISDSVTQVKRCIYHFECQMENDSTMEFRIFEYGIHLALGKSKRTKQSFKIHMPKSCVIYIGNNKNYPAKLEVCIVFPDEQMVSYQVPTIQIKEYRLEEIRKKNLFLFFPFLISAFGYQKRLKSKKSQPTKQELKDFYQHLVVLLQDAVEKCKLTEEESVVLLETLKTTEAHVLKSHPNLKGVEIVMTELLELKYLKEYRKVKREAEEAKQEAEEAKQEAEEAKQEAEEAKQEAEEAKQEVKEAKQKLKEEQFRIFIRMHKDKVDYAYIEQLAREMGITEKELREKLKIKD